MDMSFAVQAMSALYLVQHKDSLTDKLIPVPREVDQKIARRKLASLGLSIDVLTPNQEEYLHSSAI